MKSKFNKKNTFIECCNFSFNITFANYFTLGNIWKLKYYVEIKFVISLSEQGWNKLI